MLVIHVHIEGKDGSIERSYDFLRNDGEEELRGTDILIPFDEDNPQPIQERDALSLINNKDIKGDH